MEVSLLGTSFLILVESTWQREKYEEKARCGLVIYVGAYRTYERETEADDVRKRERWMYNQLKVMRTKAEQEGIFSDSLRSFLRFLDIVFDMSLSPWQDRLCVSLHTRHFPSRYNSASSDRRPIHRTLWSSATFTSLEDGDVMCRLVHTGPKPTTSSLFSYCENSNFTSVLQIKIVRFNDWNFYMKNVVSGPILASVLNDYPLKLIAFNVI